MDEARENEEGINIMTLGKSSIGKTSFITRFTEDIFQSSYFATVGIDYKTRIINIKNEQYKLIFYDTAGQEKYKSLSLNMIKKAHGIIIMYDITDKSSFDSVPEILNNIKELKGNDFPMILLGNKIDREEERQISKEEGEKLARENEIDFYEISNKDGTNVQEAGMDLVSIIIERRKRNEDSIDKSYNIKTSQISNVSMISKYSNFDSDRCSRC